MVPQPISGDQTCDSFDLSATTRNWIFGEDMYLERGGI
jgi:hypothetical protein